MRFELGDFVKRNLKQMIYPTINTTNDVKLIARGNEYEIISRRSAAAGYVYGMKSVKTGMTYDVSVSDMTDYFDRIDKTSQIETKPEPKPVIKPCTCNSLELFRFGCSCGAIPNCQDLKYNNMLSDMFGPEKD